MVFDRFHIMRHIVETVGKVRKQEHKALMDKGDATLVKSKYLWLTNPSDMTDQAKERFRELQSNELRPDVLGCSMRCCGNCGATRLPHGR